MAEGKAKGIERLVWIMERLRGEEGCPWDRRQTFESMKPFLIEEAHEAVDAIERKDFAGLEEELGDLLFHIVFLCRLAEEKGLFDIWKVIDRVAEKMISRHPHVFGSLKVSGPQEVEINWSKLKQREKGRSSVLEGLPKSLPALMLAFRMGKRASKVGFDWEDPSGVWEKLKEEMEELREAAEEGRKERVEEELGDFLFTAVNLSRFLGVEPEGALRGACRRFAERFRFIEEELRRRGKTPEEASLEEMDELWERSKRG